MVGTILRTTFEPASGRALAQPGHPAADGYAAGSTSSSAMRATYARTTNHLTVPAGPGRPGATGHRDQRG